MPLVIGVLALGLGVKLAGNGVDQAGNGGLKIAGAAVLAGAGVYLLKRGIK
ncbi:hypothetical protein [Oceanobacter sp. 3_MG-2023]|uniref:hypothetical protein n=1 Tax=Oceanobacter sp. 3_MG-2023 TaxID=3062622 RepID=UPI00273493A2|nr:hypothetical protein [Oceanobacter sp. 3_MG-2023]MDP2505641.1 hypothetical protein [Oceanobacter sp. 3_MG-2023]